MRLTVASWRGQVRSAHGVANPVGQMWAAAMMLEHLGEAEAGRTVIASFEAALASGTRSRDLGGTAGTEEFTDAVITRLQDRAATVG